MNICVLTPVLDAFKGGNHLPLLGACTDVQFTIVTNRTKPMTPDLPSNVEVITLEQKLGPFYYGCMDFRFASVVLKRYPPESDFWKSFDCIHLNQTLHPSLLKLEQSGTPVLYAVHHPVSVDLQIAVQQTTPVWLAKYALLKYWQKKICKNASHIMTVSNTVKQRLHQDYGCDLNKVHIVPNGVDGNVFKPLCHPEEPRMLSFETSTASQSPPQDDMRGVSKDDATYDACAVGSFIHPRKGFKYLLEAYKRLPELKIADVGRRSAEQQKELAKLSHVTSLGMVDHEDLVRTIQSSKLLISTSLYEGFGISLIEALACGRSVVAFDSGAVREVLAPIDSGAVVEQQDTGALVLRIRERLQISEEKRLALREKTLELYSLEGAAEKLQALYRFISA